MFQHTLVHACVPTYKRAHVIRATEKEAFFSVRSHFTLLLCVILTISDRRILLSPKLWASCLMMFYHALGIVFTFSCMFKKRLKNTPYYRMVVSVKGAIDMLSSRLPPSPCFSSSLLLISPSFQDLTFSLKVPFSLLSFHQRLSKGALILKAGLAWKARV